MNYPEVLLIVRATNRWELIFGRLFVRETDRKARCETASHLGNQM